jgi:hypothetical protein
LLIAVCFYIKDLRLFYKFNLRTPEEIGIIIHTQAVSPIVLVHNVIKYKRATQGMMPQRTEA